MRWGEQGLLRPVAAFRRRVAQPFTTNRTILWSFPAVTTIRVRRSLSARRARSPISLAWLSNARCYARLDVARHADLSMIEEAAKRLK
jgi:hypothetical protein